MENFYEFREESNYRHKNNRHNNNRHLIFVHRSMFMNVSRLTNAYGWTFKAILASMIPKLLTQHELQKELNGLSLTH